MSLKAPAIVGDAEAVRDIFVEAAFRRGFRVGQLAPPLDGDHLPSCRCALLNDIGAERTGNNIANPLKIRHWKPPYVVLMKRFMHFADQSSVRNLLGSLRRPDAVGTAFNAHPAFGGIQVDPAGEERLNRPWGADPSFLRPFGRE